MTTLSCKMKQPTSQTTTITRSRAMRLQREVHALLCEIHFKVDENFILPKCSTLVVLRHIHEDDETTKYGDEVNSKKQSDQ
jgi:hypothetical protein